MEISKEAKEAAYDEIQLYLLDAKNPRRGLQVQRLINQSTAPLREEIERLNSRIVALEKKRFEDDPEMVFDDDYGWLHIGQRDFLKSQENQITQLEKQVLGLRETFGQLLQWGPYSTNEKCLAAFFEAKLVLQGTVDPSSHYTKREVLEKCQKSIEQLYDPANGCADYEGRSGYLAQYSFQPNSIIDLNLKEALTLATEELKKGQRE